MLTWRTARLVVRRGAGRGRRPDRSRSMPKPRNLIRWHTGRASNRFRGPRPGAAWGWSGVDPSYGSPCAHLGGCPPCWCNSASGLHAIAVAVLVDADRTGFAVDGRRRGQKLSVDRRRERRPDRTARRLIALCSARSVRECRLSPQARIAAPGVLGSACRRLTETQRSLVQGPLLTPTPGTQPGGSGPARTNLGQTGRRKSGPATFLRVRGAARVEADGGLAGAHGSRTHPAASGATASVLKTEARTG
jgi:hypothetical protein